MSVQFGRWNIDGAPVDQGYLAKAGQMLDPYGPDGGSAYIKDNVGILYRAFHTTKESRKETQPLVTPSGAVLCWDGRLDNREDLVRERRGTVTAGSTDLAIVAAAYEAWGTKCFAKLIGDWALSVWDPRSRSVILAKDPIGTRHLYYSSDEKQIIWSTILDPLVLLAGKTFTLEEEYIAGWLSFFPATHLTPYAGIHSVPPSCYVRLEPGQQTIRKYWDFDSSKRIRYRIDGEYEEHFRQVFGEAVRRRLRSDSPVLAELSGGMDSSSIVCMADAIIARGAAETPRLDTISYYDDSEPNWNERPYFTMVEEKRGRTGHHVNLSGQKLFDLELDSTYFAVTPASCDAHHSKSSRQSTIWEATRENRVVLSGIGGDEITGGVPTPIPELADLLAGMKFVQLAHCLKVWALAKRKPWLHLVAEAMREFLPPALAGGRGDRRPPSWLKIQFVRRNGFAITGYEVRTKIFGPDASFQSNLATLDTVRRQMACEVKSSDLLHEKRYPYLDLGLLEFMYGIPREQVVRPAERRSLMRRALIGIVPDEILTRKRKAFVSKAPRVALRAEWGRVSELTRNMSSGSFGVVDPKEFSALLRQARQGEVVAVVPLLRSLTLEKWLQQLRLDGGTFDWRAIEKRTRHEQRPSSFRTKPDEIQPQ